MAERSVPALDLAECEREPIHIPGAIQPHGVLFSTTVEAPHSVLQVSANVERLLGFPITRVLGAPLVDLFAPEPRDAFTRLLAEASVRRHRFPILVGGRRWDALVHHNAGVLVIELEAASQLAVADLVAEQAALRELMATILGAESAAALHRALPSPLRRLTGYDRVMVYLFDDNGDGAVVAEDREPELEPYLGLRYPASDIPAQARRLYVAEPSRVIVDARYEPVALVPRLRADTGAPLDLSHAALRSVSPIHCVYLENMGVRASMSISLLDGERLFGLIAFHHRTPHLPRYELRDACASLGRVASFVHLARTRERTDAAICEAAQTVHRLVEQVDPTDVAEGLIGKTPCLLDLIDAPAAMVRSQGVTRLVGAAPPLEFAEPLARWLMKVGGDDVFTSAQLASEYPAAAEHCDTACGVLAFTLGGVDLLVAWLRPEVIRTVTWGGNPNEPVIRHANGEIGPRRSFALWREQVRGRALPFEPDQRQIADLLRRQLEQVVVKRAAELDRLNRELEAALATRDDFLSIASHELKTPLSTLLLTIEGLERSLADAPTQARVPHRLSIAKRQVIRLDQLVTGLLDVSRIHANKLELELAEADLVATVHEVVERLAILDSTITVSGLEALRCRFDRLRIDQVVTNLLANAIKYAGEGPVEVEVESAGGLARVCVRDHGPGIPAELASTLFQRFARARVASTTSGFGLGLWIAQAIVRAHHGEIHVEDTPGGGTTMVVEFPCEESETP